MLELTKETIHFFLKCISPKEYSLHLFEPNIRLFNRLKNKFPKNTHIHNNALGEKTEKVNFYSKSDLNDTGSSSIVNHYYLDKVDEVSMITLDDFVYENKIKNIDFIKIDVEGYEVPILNGASKSLKNGIFKFIQIEYSQQWVEVGGSLKKVLELISEFDYSLYRIKSNKLIKISKYSFLLEDFVYCNFLLAKNDEQLPMKMSKKSPLPFEI